MWRLGKQLEAQKGWLWLSLLVTLIFILSIYRFFSFMDKQDF